MKWATYIILVFLSLFIVYEISLAETKIEAEKYLRPSYFGMLEIISRGYVTSIFINGIEQKKTTDSATGVHVKGKLKIGKNTIKINVSKIEDSLLYKAVVIKLFLIDKNKKYKNGFTINWGDNEEYEKVYTFAPNNLFEGKIEKEFIIKKAIGTF